MLDVSAEVKNLFQTDGILKNIRVSFPNGEYADVCNDRIIKESLRFDESISSREMICFGLCESSQISFECVGLDADVKGMEIAVYIEIDTTGTEIPSETAEDVPFPFYRVPLGHFIIDEAKLDSKMMVRKITGYSRFSSLPEYDWWTLINWQAQDGPTQEQDKTLNLNVLNYLYSANSEIFNLSDVPGTAITGWAHLHYEDNAVEITVPIKSALSGTTYHVDFVVPESLTYFCRIEEYSRYHPWGTLSELGRLDTHNLSASYESSLESAIENLRTHQGAGFEPITDEDVLDEVRRIVGILANFDPMNFFKTIDSGYGIGSGIVVSAGHPLKEGDVFMLPPYLTVFMTVYVGIQNSQESYPVTILDSINDVSVSKIDPDNNDFTIKVAPEILLKTETGGIYSFLRPILFLDPRVLLESWVELQGKFGRIGRDGYFELLTIAEVILDGLFPAEDLYPAEDLFPKEYGLATVDPDDEEIIPNNASIDLWYERKFVEFGRLICEYTSSEILDDDGNPMQAFYESSWEGKGQRYIYDVSNNEIIRNNTYTASEIQALLEPLLQALKKIRYYRAEVESVGLPYIEAGDQMMVYCHNQQLLVLNLSRTLNGIQSLRDKVKTD